MCPNVRMEYILNRNSGSKNRGVDSIEFVGIAWGSISGGGDHHPDAPFTRRGALKKAKRNTAYSKSNYVFDKHFTVCSRLSRAGHPIRVAILHAKRSRTCIFGLKAGLSRVIHFLLMRHKFQASPILSVNNSSRALELASCRFQGVNSISASNVSYTTTSHSALFDTRIQLRCFRDIQSSTPKCFDRRADPRPGDHTRQGSISGALLFSMARALDDIGPISSLPLTLPALLTSNQLPISIFDFTNMISFISTVSVLALSFALTDARALAVHPLQTRQGGLTCANGERMAANRFHQAAREFCRITVGHTIPDSIVVNGGIFVVGGKGILKEDKSAVSSKSNLPLDCLRKLFDILVN
ncbi:uncharacterized protein BDR25DRAFT_358443 [Lindgomyces ingoldianus]|uniref:Uncharacterized protein n=1 Tax=Lindgomyces ingoldianus TaxID=673940 RepID=A0ACB6QNR0_9PLEO|nr:uncharacterized protein BDR25DRAFT_358443 [Lindgomyces ingoldianus]KAF2467750.1 hypothetical protein BDR25DRAFT_358443 [Lindgomyces ingoldianus]